MSNKSTHKLKAGIILNAFGNNNFQIKNKNAHEIFSQSGIRNISKGAFQ